MRPSFPKKGDIEKDQGPPVRNELIKRNIQWSPNCLSYFLINTQSAVNKYDEINQLIKNRGHSIFLGFTATCLTPKKQPKHLYLGWVFNF